MVTVDSKPKNNRTNARGDALGKPPTLGTSSTVASRKSDIERPLSPVHRWEAIFKHRFLATRDYSAPDNMDPIQAQGFKQFYGWLRFHKPPFPESKLCRKPFTLSRVSPFEAPNSAGQEPSRAARQTQATNSAAGLLETPPASNTTLPSVIKRDGSPTPHGNC